MAEKIDLPAAVTVQGTFYVADLEKQLEGSSNLEDQLVLCKYCKEVISESVLTVHYEECQSCPVPCPNLCGAKPSRKNLKKHVKKCCRDATFSVKEPENSKKPLKQALLHNSPCPKDFVKCPNGCDAFIPQEAIKEHCFVCTKQLFKCRHGCNTFVPREELPIHYSQCAKVKIKCPNGCEVLREELPEHNLQCPKTTCPNGCILFREELPEHDLQCPKALVTCPNGCKVLREELPVHVLQCPKALVTCPNGCKILKEELPEHDLQCPKALVTCPNGCMVLREELPEHALYCPKALVTCHQCGCAVLREEIVSHYLDCQVPIKCPKQCGATLIRSTLPIHISECPKEKIQCPDCKVSLLRKNISRHESKCSALVSCMFGCEVLKKELALHNSSLCPKAIIECPNDGCQISMERKDLINHTKFSCPKAIISCPHCKKISMLKEELPEHELSCPKVYVNCPISEDCRVQRENLSLHNLQCPEGYIECPNGCNVSVKRKNVKRHENDCPKAIIECPHGCYNLLLREEANNHWCQPVNYSCRDITTCYDCKASILRGELLKHKSCCPKFYKDVAQCGKYNSPCPVDCPAMNFQVHCKLRSLHFNPLWSLHDVLSCEFKESKPTSITQKIVEYYKSLLKLQRRLTIKPVSKCPMSCGNHLQKKNLDLDEHLTLSCQEVVNTCDFCDSSLKRRLVQRYHWSRIGPQYSQPIQCPKMCSTQLMTKDLIEHLSESCPKVIISCPEGCGMRLSRKQLAIITFVFSLPRVCSSLSFRLLCHDEAKKCQPALRHRLSQWMWSKAQIR